MPDYHGHANGDAPVDFGRLLGPVARELLGEPTEKHRGGQEWRYGTRGSLKIDLGKGVWRDHEANVGGGTLDLLKHRAGFEKPAALAWLRDHKLIEDRPKPGAKKPREVAAYDYRDEDGALLFQVVRFEPKDFRQRQPNGKDGWIWKMAGVRLVPYRLPELVAAIGQGRAIYITEGEKGVQSLVGLGLAATCSPGGAGKWRKDYARPFAGADVVILPDNDDAGRKHAEQVTASLLPVARSIRVLALPDLPAKGDVADWIEAGGTLAQIEELAAKASKVGAKPKEPLADRPGHDLPRIISAAALMEKVLPPLRFAVNDLLPVGYTVLAGPPKLGKSWLAYQLALAVASGADLFGHATMKGEVLYLAMEDGERRMQSRLERLLGKQKPPASLSLATDWPRLDNGGMLEIEMWARECGDAARLVIIDTLQKIRPPSSKAGNAYEQDYELHGKLHGLAHRLGIALVTITHMRKGSSGGDWVEGVIGSGGITGSADTIMALKRDRGGADAFLSVTGRDVREDELALRSDEGVWSFLGSAGDVRRTATQKSILDALAAAGAKGLTPREVADATDLSREMVKKALGRMAKADMILNLGGRYARIGM
jgi:hypothetical protein